MERIIIIDDKKYQIIEDYKDGYDDTEFKAKVTDFFDEYDYIVGDWAYSKLRLKGFYENNNKKVKGFNNYDKVKEYLQNNCAYGCKYFIVKRVYKS